MRSYGVGDSPLQLELVEAGLVDVVPPVAELDTNSAAMVHLQEVAATAE
jgi:hypothetical protein